MNSLIRVNNWLFLKFFSNVLPVKSHFSASNLSFLLSLDFLAALQLNPTVKLSNWIILSRPKYWRSKFVA